MSEFTILYDVLMLIMMFIVTSVEVYSLSKFRKNNREQQQIQIHPPPVVPPIHATTPYQIPNLNNYSSFNPDK